MNKPISLRQELLRKSIHLSSIWLPVTYAFVTRETMLLLVVLAACVVVALELMKRHLHPLRDFFQLFFGSILRAHEQDALTGASHALIAAVFTIWLFEKPVAMVALGMLVICDTAAALIGRRFGKHKLLDKSWEGTITFVLSGWLVVGIMQWFFPQPMWFVVAGMLGAITAAITELYSKRISVDDNLLIPLAAAATIWLVTIF